ncbi:hypothetical protein F2B00_22100 [Streptomyces parvus]|uniref:hypothetical protein n=1 Tax=Streptomyces parvus TaxID=66428 RepID=UPI0012392D09|nr:hypothetical protein [Streptomyces parvus]KAA6200075.1 hypothetical protein F2B00_22100 [Streptomyces parvus]GGS41523.1 hypothetical protein GCM10010221_45430 [Streptomyces parvus]
MTTQAETPEPVTYHWIATIQTARGQIATDDGPVTAVPGVHTHTTIYQNIQAYLEEKYGANFVVLFFSLTPDQL